MKTFDRLLALLAGMATLGCHDLAAPSPGQPLDVTVPRLASVTSQDRPSPSVTDPSEDGAQPPSDGEAQPPSDGEAQPPSEGEAQPSSDGYPPEFDQPADVPNAWTRVGIGADVVGAEAYMEYFASSAEQTLSLVILADGRQIAAAPPARSAARWPFPVFGSLRTFASVPVATTCGIMGLASAVHRAQNELAIPGKSPWVFSDRTRSTSGTAGEPVCDDPTRPPPPQPPAGGEGGGGDAPQDDNAAFLSCWWILTYDGDTLVEVEPISCTIVS